MAGLTATRVTTCTCRARNGCSRGRSTRTAAPRRRLRQARSLRGRGRAPRNLDRLADRPQPDADRGAGAQHLRDRTQEHDGRIRIGTVHIPGRRPRCDRAVLRRVPAHVAARRCQPWKPTPSKPPTSSTLSWVCTTASCAGLNTCEPACPPAGGHQPAYPRQRPVVGHPQRITHTPSGRPLALEETRLSGDDTQLTYTLTATTPDTRHQPERKGRN